MESIAAEFPASSVINTRFTLATICTVSGVCGLVLGRVGTSRQARQACQAPRHNRAQHLKF